MKILWSRIPKKESDIYEFYENSDNQGDNSSDWGSSEASNAL